MLLPGTYTLIATAVTTAQTAQAYTPITGLEGILSANLCAEVIGFSGGTSIALIAQISRDGGTTWLDVARFNFTGAGKKYANLQRFAAKAVTAYAALGSEAVNDGLFGPMMRGVITSVDTFTNTTVLFTLDAA